METGSFIADAINRIKVVMTASATLITAVVVFLSTISFTLPEDWQTAVAQVIVALSGAVAFIRRHTPVDKSEYGVLPNEDPGGV